MRTTLLALGLTLSLIACGGGGGPTALTDDGYAALGKGDDATALSKFEDALEGLAGTDVTDESYLRAKMGQIQALTAEDAARAQSEFMALASKTELSARQYRTVGTQLFQEKAFTEATAILDAGVKKFPDDATFTDLIGQVAAGAKEAGDTGALDALDGLGYIGE